MPEPSDFHFSDFLFYDELSDRQRRALQERLAGDPELRTALQRWQALRDEVRRQLDTQLPERELLVLYVLDDAVPDALTEAERDRLEAARADIDQALAAHPGLRDVTHRIEAERADFEAAWQAHVEGDGSSNRRRTSERRASSRPAQRPAVVRWGWRAAAVLAVVAFAAIFTMVVQRDSDMLVAEAPEDGTRVVELADGSTARLYAGARLSYANPDAASVAPQRSLLEGRAFFDVAPTTQSFVVETNTARATVLGTSFGIEAHDDATEVTLATGRLALAPRNAQDQFVVLEPGQMSRVAEDARPSTPVDVELETALGWTQLFLFDRTPVHVIARRLGDHYDVAVTVASSLREERVTGTFDPQRGAGEILRVVAATLDADVARTNDGFHLHPAP